MASKRRNMFYQNKKQETTGIDPPTLVILLGCDGGGCGPCRGLSTQHPGAGTLTQEEAQPIIDPYKLLADDLKDIYRDIRQETTEKVVWSGHRFRRMHDTGPLRGQSPLSNSCVAIHPVEFFDIVLLPFCPAS
ncbi:hypothetical protein AAG570_010251 [Ranatra chinensis]|uniref:Uncharacterized protein n=1 Tax=Ranatra chinensis TaxID=642074 RepID=A0ABD0YM34_9HEMI